MSVVAREAVKYEVFYMALTVCDMFGMIPKQKYGFISSEGVVSNEAFPCEIKKGIVFAHSGAIYKDGELTDERWLANDIIKSDFLKFRVGFRSWNMW